MSSRLIAVQFDEPSVEIVRLKVQSYPIEDYIYKITACVRVFQFDPFLQSERWHARQSAPWRDYLDTDSTFPRWVQGSATMVSRHNADRVEWGFHRDPGPEGGRLEPVGTQASSYEPGRAVHSCGGLIFCSAWKLRCPCWRRYTWGCRRVAATLNTGWTWWPGHLCAVLRGCRPQPASGCAGRPASAVAGCGHPFGFKLAKASAREYLRDRVTVHSPV